ncbi:MAG: DUF3253 domain-containing protein [Actinobacteria bacterium]|nr:DUF3253 domain-containing protein [Actinomycetota bacterium]
MSDDAPRGVVAAAGYDELVDDDARWITIEGRRWRRSDPAIPPTLRQELVDELMAARRAVAAEHRSGDAAGVRRARDRVHAAKLALGERGAPWWEQPNDDDLRRRVAATIDVLARHRAPDRTICPSDAARVVGGPGWRRHMDLVRDVAADMADDHRVEITQRGRPVPGRTWRGPVRIRSRAPADDE